MAPFYLGTKRVLRFFKAIVAAATGFSAQSLAAMDVAYQGQPFVSGPTQAGTSTLTMDIAYQGQPFVRYNKT